MAFKNSTPSPFFKRLHEKRVGEHTETAAPWHPEPGAFRPVMAAGILVAILSTQCVLPLAWVMADTAKNTGVTGGVSRLGRRLAQNLDVAAGQAIPRERLVQRGKPKPSEDTGCTNCAVTMAALDLKKVPTETDLRRAGQLGGALTPTASADVELLKANSNRELRSAGVAAGLSARVPATTSAGRLVQLKRDKVERLETINKTFGAAIQEWNKHNFTPAAKMFKEHVERFPDSPWAGEAMLHLGCDAKYNGRFAEAEAQYRVILDNTSEKTGEPSNDIHQKAKLRWADLDISLGRLDDANAKLKNILQSDQDWRRRTWAQQWVRYVHLYQQNARDLRACGSQALSYIMASLGRRDASIQLAQLKASSTDGYNLAELQTLAGKYGVPMRGFRTTAEGLASLPTPFVIHYDFSGTPQPKVQLKTPNDLTPLPKLAAAPAKKPAAKTKASPFQVAQRTGHFLIVRRVDTKTRKVHLFDPQEKRVYQLSYADLNKEWSGTGLVRNIPAKKTAAAGRVAYLQPHEMKEVIGGCCGAPRLGRNFGEDDGNSPPIIGCKFGSPALSINQISVNMFIEDTPLWYQTPVGPDVEITMSFNSQDAVNQRNIMGNKWVFNYASYIIQDTGVGGGQATIFMPDGRQDNYQADGAGNWVAPSGKYTTLRQLKPMRWELEFQSGEKYIYDLPAGTTSLQPVLVEIRDAWGYSLKMGYQEAGYNINLTTITDALGQVTKLQYDANGHVVMVWDPFGRHSTFQYDQNGNMVQVTDMEGNAFQYTYNRDVFITQISTAQGPWKFDWQSPFNGGMDNEMHLTITDPLNQDESYHWDGLPGLRRPVYHVDQRGNRTEFFSDQLLDGNGLITETIYPNGDVTKTSYDRTTGLPVTSVSPRGAISTAIYNSQGNTTATTDPKGNVSRVTYAANGIDVASVIDATGRTVVTYSGYTNHQPTTIAEDPNGENNISTVTYTAWGAVATLTDAESKVTTYTYDGTTKRLTSVAEGATTMGSFTYDEVGRVKTSTDSDGQTLAYTYDDLDHPVSITYPDGSQQIMQYACCGQLAMMRDREGRFTWYDYDPLKRLARTQDSAGNSFQIGYDPAGNRNLLVDSKGNITRWDYDNMDRLAKKQYADGSGYTYVYDTQENTVSKTDAQGRPFVSYYDDNGNLLSIDNPESADLSYTYDALDRLMQMKDGIGITKWAYDSRGNIESEDGPFANDTQTYTYDDLGRRATYKVNNTDTVSYNYDALDRLASIGSPAGTFTYNYNSLKPEQLQELVLPNGSKTSYSYDALERLVSVANKKSDTSNISTYGYGFDDVNKKDARQWIEKQVDADPLKHIDYVYDSIDQLKREVSTEPTPTYDLSYDYDKMGNRTAHTEGPGSWSYSYTANKLNQITQIAGTHPTLPATSTTLQYDPNGNLTGNGNTQYQYDDYDRLTAIIQPTSVGENHHRSYFSYDGFNRRVQVVEQSWDIATNTWNTDSATRYIYDGMDVVQERNTTDNTITAKYVRSGNIGGLLARIEPAVGETPEKLLFYHYDGSGNVTQLTDSTQAVVAKYDYDAYGRILSSSGVEANQPYRYSTKWFHSRSGLYDYGYRFYSPGMGRWINRDPIQENGGLNLYAAFANSPANQVDSYGEVVETAWDALNIGIGGASMAQNIRNGDYGWAAIDGAGILVDAAAAFTPFVPGGAGSAIAATRAASTGAKAIKATATVSKVRTAAKVIASNAPTLPPGRVASEDGVDIDHYYHGDDHGYAHVHVSEGGRPSTRVGQNGKPYRRDPPLTPKQAKVVKKNLSKIRRSCKKIGKWLQHKEKS